jgi:hypothetical protein
MRDWTWWKGWPPPKRDSTQSRSRKCTSTGHCR